MSSPQAVLDAGEPSFIAALFKKLKIGTFLFGKSSAGLSEVIEDLSVSSDAATLTYTPVALLSAQVFGGSSGNGPKRPMHPGESPIRVVTETLDVASAAATPSYTVQRLLHAKTNAGVGAAGEKAALKNGATPSTGEAAANSGGTSITLNAESTGTVTSGLTVSYLTSGGCVSSSAKTLSFKASEVAGASAKVRVRYLTAATTVAKNASGEDVPLLAASTEWVV